PLLAALGDRRPERMSRRDPGRVGWWQRVLPDTGGWDAMNERGGLRGAALVAPALILGIAAVSVAATVEPLGMRLPLLAAAVSAVVAIVWRAAELTHQRSADALAAVAASSDLRRVGLDRRLPIFDRDTGAYSAWYFRLRVEEEIARADRFGERFSVLSISCDARSSLHVGTVASKKLREVDFAGNLGSNVAIVLPRTDR